MYKSYSMELAGRTLTVDIGRVAKQANGAALMHYGDTTVLATATASKEPREGIDFFPLSVEYEEKMYAVGKIFSAKIQAKAEGKRPPPDRRCISPAMPALNGAKARAAAYASAFSKGLQK